MALSSTEFIQSVPTLKTRTVAVPGIGEVIVSELTALQAEKLTSQNFPVGPDGTVTFNRVGRSARWAIATLRNPDGTPMFADTDFDRVASMPVDVLAPIVKAAQELNGVESDADPVDEAAKN
jgi:hypothetical protein